MLPIISVVIARMFTMASMILVTFYIGNIFLKKNIQKACITFTSLHSVTSQPCKNTTYKKSDLEKLTKFGLEVYKTIIWPVVTYRCEAWILTKDIECLLNIWRRNILKRMFDSVKVNNIRKIRSVSYVWRTRSVSVSLKPQD